MKNSKSNSRSKARETLRIIYFATTSEVKFNQYKTIFEDLGVELRHGTVVTSALIEPQVDSSDPQGEQALVLHPLRQAARFAVNMNQIPYMIEDTMLLIDAFSAKKGSNTGLPGADTKNWWRNLGVDGLIKLMRDVEDRGAKFICQIGIYLRYFRESEYRYVRSELAGTISERPRVSERAKIEQPRTNPHFFHSVFQPSGWDLTLAEMGVKDFTVVDYRRKCAKKLLEELRHIEWLQSVQLRLPFD